VRPDLLLAGARRADVLLQQAHANSNCLDRRIHGTTPTADQRLASVRVRLPTALNGCGIRSAVITSPRTSPVARCRALHRRRVIQRFP
jgi:hypothetical protein